ncbi:Uncharacterized protein SCF082_LOCUS7735 [Durusdinium trenchii]|uniref:Uncharacterized protein n=1 Tax=Durusdinium trenchii TaxID=1381693 RepID=A0ABP0ILF5_9DINO
MARALRSGSQLMPVAVAATVAAAGWAFVAPPRSVATREVNRSPVAPRAPADTTAASGARLGGASVLLTAAGLAAAVGLARARPAMRAGEEKEMEKKPFDVWEPSTYGNISMDDVKKYGTAGTLSYVITELLFWAIAFPTECIVYLNTAGHWPDFSKPEESAAVFGLVFAASNIARLLLPLRFGAALAMAPWVDENIMQKFFKQEAQEAKEGKKTSWPQIRLPNAFRHRSQCFNVAAWTKSLAMTLLRAPRGRKSAESLSLTIPWEALGRGAQAERPAEEPMTESSRGSLVLGMQKTLAHATAVTTCATRGASDLASALCSQGCRMTLHASDSVKSTAEVLQSQGPKIAHVVCATSSALCQGAAELKAALQTAAEKLPNPPAEKPPNTGLSEDSKDQTRCCPHDEVVQAPFLQMIADVGTLARGPGELRIYYEPSRDPANAAVNQKPGRRTDTPERRPDGVAHAAPLAPVQRRGDGEAARELKVARCAQAAQKRWKDAASNSMKASLKPRPRLPLQKAGAGHRTHASSNSPLHVLR